MKPINTNPASWNAPYLYGVTQDREPRGEREKCHWCGNPCEAINRHDDPPPIMGVRSPRSSARMPGSHYICTGCFLWRRGSVTIPFLDDKSWDDRQSPQNHSWWLQETEARAIRLPNSTRTSSADIPILYNKLIHPPTQEAFCLAMVTSGYVSKLHQAKVNYTSSGFTQNSPIHFTLNNAEHTYTVYELQEAMRTGKNGKEPGVRALLDTLGPPPSGVIKPEKITAGAPEEHAQVLRKKV